MLNLKIEGLPEEVINELVERGIASNKSEAIRLAILHYNDHYGIKPIKEYLEDELAVRKMQYLDEQIAKGKRKLISAKEALGKYSKLLE